MWPRLLISIVYTGGEVSGEGAAGQRLPWNAVPAATEPRQEGCLLPEQALQSGGGHRSCQHHLHDKPAACAGTSSLHTSILLKRLSALVAMQVCPDASLVTVNCVIAGQSQKETHWLQIEQSFAAYWLVTNLWQSRTSV